MDLAWDLKHSTLMHLPTLENQVALDLILSEFPSIRYHICPISTRYYNILQTFFPSQLMNVLQSNNNAFFQKD